VPLRADTEVKQQMSPKFTIGIPTYNRAGFLREALGFAVGQTLEDLEVVVSDNASTDDTAEVAHEAGCRVRYFRNPANIGQWANFRKAVELAKGEYFSWLQDDDALHCEFARRAYDVLESMPDVVAYISYAVNGPSLSSIHFTPLYGPPFAVDWLRSVPRRIDGKLVAPLSLMMSVAIPPTIAFRTSILREYLGLMDGKSPLYTERSVLAAVASRGSIVVDPRVGGFFREHAEQSWRAMWKDRRNDMTQWEDMAWTVQRTMSSWDESWKDALRSELRKCPAVYRERWRQSAQSWPCDSWLCTAVKEILEADLPPLSPTQHTPSASSKVANALGIATISASLWQKTRRAGRRVICLCTGFRHKP